MTGEEQQLRRGVIELIRVHGADQAHLIGDGVEVRAGIAHGDAAFAIARKGTRCAHELRHAGGEGEAAAFENGIGAVLPAALHELRFVIKQVEVRRRTRHVQVDHALGLRRILRLLGCQRIVRCRTGSRLLLHRMHGDGSQAELPCVAEELAARLELKGVVSDGVHGEVRVKLPAHQKLIQVHHHIGDGCPRGEFGDVGVFGGGAERVGGHLGGIRWVGAVGGERFVVELRQR